MQNGSSRVNGRLLFSTRPPCRAYLHWVLFSVYGVFRARASIRAPVQVELKRLVRHRKIPPGQYYFVRQIQLNWGEKMKLKSQNRFKQINLSKVVLF